MITDEELSRRLNEFDKNNSFVENLQKAREQIGEFNNKFGDIKNLKLDDYVLGKGENTFSHWIEFKTREVANIGGGTALKHGIYYSSKEKKYKFLGQERENLSATQYFNRLKKELIKLYEFAQKDNPSESDFEGLTQIELPKAMLIKVAYLLNPNNFLPIMSGAHLNKLCAFFNIDTEVHRLQRNRKILEKFRKNAISKDWHTLKIMYFCYSPESGFNLKDSDEENSVDIPTVANNDAISLLFSKQQIILYGPPGTGKTYKTKELALSLLENVYRDQSKPKTRERDWITDLIFSPKHKVSNELFKYVDNYVKGLEISTSRDNTSMRTYKTFSKRLKKDIGLVWLEFPQKADTSFKIHLRKDGPGAKYPEDILNKFRRWRRYGWGEYPEFTIESMEDARNVIKLIQYAYENL